MYQSLQEALTRQRTKYIIRSLTSEIGWAVQSGPFEGMRYVPKAVGSTLPPKLLGSYESELHPTINLIVKNKYEKVIDIGCAEGYYAIGLALKNPSAVVYAFDIDENGQALCTEMAQINDVHSRVIIQKECTHQDLQALVSPGCLIICDCEGCELELLQPSLVPRLADCDLLVELHEGLKPGLSDELLGRFKRTHEIQLINSQDRDPRVYPILQRFSRINQKVALSELRDVEMQWAFMMSRDIRSR
jgi:hypothetical protein